MPHRPTPFDTGERCEPVIWDPANPNFDEETDFGKVDFENDESATVAVVYVKRTEDGYALVVEPIDDTLEIIVED